MRLECGAMLLIPGQRSAKGCRDLHHPVAVWQQHTASRANGFRDQRQTCGRVPPPRQDCVPILLLCPALVY